jgi:hypothetical protein
MALSTRLSGRRAYAWSSDSTVCLVPHADGRGKGIKFTPETIYALIGAAGGLILVVGAGFGIRHIVRRMKKKDEPDEGRSPERW